MAPEYQKQRGRCPLYRFRYERLFAQVVRCTAFAVRTYVLSSISCGEILYKSGNSNTVYGITLTVRVSYYFPGRKDAMISSA